MGSVVRALAEQIDYFLKLTFFDRLLQLLPPIQHRWYADFDVFMMTYLLNSYENFQKTAPFGN